MVKVVVREMRRRKVGWLAPVLSCVADQWQNTGVQVDRQSGQLTSSDCEHQRHHSWLPCQWSVACRE
jgi:hypothetical protein